MISNSWWSDAEKIIGLTSPKFSFFHSFPLKEVGCHMFSLFTIRCRCPIIINCYPMMKDEYSSCNHLSFEGSKEHTSCIGVPQNSKKCNIILFWVL